MGNGRNKLKSCGQFRIKIIIFMIIQTSKSLAILLPIPPSLFPSDMNGALLMCSLYFQIKYTLSNKLTQTFDFKVILSWEAKVPRRPSLEIQLMFLGMDMRSSSSQSHSYLVWNLWRFLAYSILIRLKDQRGSLYRKHFVMSLKQKFPFLINCSVIVDGARPSRLRTVSC